MPQFNVAINNIRENNINSADKPQITQHTRKRHFNDEGAHTKQKQALAHRAHDLTLTKCDPFYFVHIYLFLTL